jgi:hypothetical protein
MPQALPPIGAEVPQASELPPIGTEVPQGRAAQTPDPNTIGTFVQHFWDTINPIQLGQLLPFPKAAGGSGTDNPLSPSNAVSALHRVKLEGDARWAQGDTVGAAAKYIESVIPLLGPQMSEWGNRLQRGEYAAAGGDMSGFVAPMVVGPALKATTRAAKAIPTSVADMAEAGATRRIVDVIAPKVGPEKLRFGGRAVEVAPTMGQELAQTGAPWTREGLAAKVGEQLTAAEAALDAASDARLSARSFPTQPLINGLLAKRKALTTEAVEGSQVPRTTVARTSPIVDERGQPITVTESVRHPIGTDVVPSPNAARVAVIDQAIQELRQLGPVTRYDPIRTMRQAYDGPAKAIYSPSMTADYMKTMGSKLGAADVTGTLREGLATWDPETAKANQQYRLYRTMDDVLAATAETERSRPRVGRQIMTRLMTTTTGAGTAGIPGAIVGFVLAPVLDSAMASGITTQLKTASLLTQLATAIRRGQLSTVDHLVAQLQRVRPAGAAVTLTAPMPTGTPAPVAAQGPPTDTTPR